MMESDELNEVIKVAEQGDADAQYELGVMYNNGMGVEQNDETSVIWYTLSAEQGFASAQYNLGVMYNDERCVPRARSNDATAVKWYTLAAEQGHAEAQWNLGIMYEWGDGVEISYKEAVKWFTKAAEKGHAKAQLHLENEGYI